MAVVRLNTENGRLKTSVFAQDADDFALDFDVGGGDDDGLHL